MILQLRGKWAQFVMSGAAANYHLSELSTWAVRILSSVSIRLLVLRTVFAQRME